jgi:hypothetical protein
VKYEVERDNMSIQEIEKIIDKTVFTMEVEGFVVTDEEKDTLRKVLNGEISFDEQLQKYIEEAKRIGEESNAKYQRIRV